MVKLAGKLFLGVLMAFLSGTPVIAENSALPETVTADAPGITATVVTEVKTAVPEKRPVVKAKSAVVKQDKTVVPAGNTNTAAAPAGITETVAPTAGSVLPAAAGKAQYELEDVVITGTKTRLKIKDSPAAVSVIDQEKLKKKAAVYSDDLVTGLPGVQVERTAKGNQSTNVTMRGIVGDARNLILLDGLSLQNPLNGRVFWNRVPVDLVERVEVVRGPFSSLYGKYAIGGVINLITKEPEGRSLNVTNNYDSTNVRTFSINFRDKPFNNFAYYLALENESVDGYIYHQYILGKVTKTAAAATTVTGYKETKDSQGNTVYLIGETAKQKLQNNVFSAKIYYTPFEGHTFTLLGNYSFWDQPTEDGVLGNTWLKDASGNLVSSGIVQLGTTGTKLNVSQNSFYTAPGRNNFWVVGLTYKGKINEILSLSGSAEYTSGSNLLSDGTLASNSTAVSGKSTAGGNGKQVEKKALVQAEFDLGQHRVILGSQIVNDPIRSSDTEHSFWRDLYTFTEPYDNSSSEGLIYSAYIQDEWKIIQPLTAFIGARYDNWSRKNGRIYNTTTESYVYYDNVHAEVGSPKLSLVYRPVEELSVRASAGTAFNPPTHSQMYSYSSSTTNGITTETVANPNLKPEKDTAWEFGGEYTFPTKTTISGTYFENYLTDLIYSATTNNSTTSKTTTNVNAGKATVKGFEVELKQPVASFLDVSANYTYSDPKITENSAAPATVGKTIPLIAKQRANFDLTFKWENFSFAFIESYQSKIYAQADNSDTVSGVQGSYDEYATSDVRFTYSFGNAKLSIGVENIGGKQYYANYQTPGRTYNVGLKYSWL